MIIKLTVFLNSIYKGRYPTEQRLLPHGEPSQKDAERAISAARSLMENLKKSCCKGSNIHGVKYIIDGMLQTPVGISIKVRTVWIVDSGHGHPRFVTAYPI